MSYESVLGYSKNSLIENYQEKYFQKLLTYLQKHMGDVQEIQEFLGYEPQQQKDFLLHPDISSLLQDIALHDSEESRIKILREFEFLLAGKDNRLTATQGKNIPGTNIRLTEIDNNPENSIVSHPDHDSDGMIGWGERPEEEWLQVFGNTFKLLKEVNREYFDELNSIIKKIVPIKTSRDVHNSCSYKECIGTLYLGYTIDVKEPELNILEALIHESNHNKLNLVMQSEDLHTNDNTLKYYSPYRPDARHIHGVILGVHALVSAIYVMLEAIEQDKVESILWKEKTLLYHIKNKLGFRVIEKYGTLTPVGEKLMKDIKDVLELCDKKVLDTGILKSLDIKSVQATAKQHFLDVNHNYPNLQY